MCEQTCALRLSGVMLFLTAIAAPAAAWAQAARSFDDGQTHTLSGDVTGDQYYVVDVSKPGTTVAIRDAKITAVGPETLAGVIFQSGSGGSLDNVEISTAGKWAAGLRVQNYLQDASSPGGPVITGDRVTITTEIGTGVIVYGARLMLSNSVINSGGAGLEVGQQFANHDALARLSNVTVTSVGDGVTSMFSGVVEMEGGSVTTTGDYAHGLDAWGGLEAGAAGSRIAARNVAVTTKGEGAIGVLANADVTYLIGSRISLDDVTVTTLGARAAGLRAQYNSTIEGRSVSVSTSGDGAVGAGVAINSLLTLADSKVVTSGTNAHGLRLTRRGAATLAGTQVITSGKGANGIDVVDADDQGVGSRVSLERGSAVSARGFGVNLKGGTLDLTVKDSSIGGDDGLLHLQSGGATSSVLNLAADNAILRGRAVTGAGTISNLTLKGGSTWYMVGNSNITTLDNGSGATIYLSGLTGRSDRPAPAGFNTLTVDGNYQGNGGTIVFNTQLGGDTSPTDQLVVGGNTAGSTQIIVRNRGGIGAPTVEGIKIIEVKGASQGDFRLKSDYMFKEQPVVVAGAYSYGLYKGGISTPNDGDWYLRSRLSDGSPLYQPTVPVAEAYPDVLLGLMRLPTLQQRVGNRYWCDNREAAAQEMPSAQAPRPYGCDDDATTLEGSGFWLRMEGGFDHAAPGRSTARVNRDVGRWKVQAGVDALVQENDQGDRLVLGLTGHYLGANARLFSPSADGSINTSGYGFGPTLTWYAAQGFYVDAQAQATWFNSNLSSEQARSIASNNNGFGYAFSVEAGQRLRFARDWTITPQVQLLYSQVGFDGFVDRYGAAASLQQGDRLRSRLGVSADYRTSWQDDDSQVRRLRLHAIANLYGELQGGTRVSVAGTPFESRNDAVTGEIGIGGAYNWGSDKYSVYGEIAASTSLANFGTSYGYRGTAGLRMSW